MRNISFLPVEDSDFNTIKEIYNYYILNSTATFHTEPITIEDLHEFIFVNHPYYKSFIVKENENLAGYCYLTFFKKRQAYNRTAEVTLYLKPEFCNRGIGKETLSFLEKSANINIIKNLIAVISCDNVKSIKLFEKMGYEKCAHYKKVGEKFGQILDVVSYQKFL